ncbi:MAG: VWA domain-containing protein [Bryobacteraceae bacterium]|nr:VWA domain-containing protein [Bryobacteraceae bacterium]
MKSFVSLVCAAALTAQQPAAPTKVIPQDQTGTITLDVTRVNFLLSVTDKKGRFVTNLTKEDFEITESKKPQTILEFVAESNLPLRLGVLVDTSNSIRDRFRFQQEAAVEFLKSTMRDQDKAIVVSFDTSAELIADMTNDPQKLEEAVRGLRPGGGTSLYDAIYFACRDKMMQDQPMHKFRRALVLLSDGDDNQSRYTREQALEMAQKADTVIYTISTNITRMPSDGDKVLKYFAEQTGGSFFTPFKATDLAQSFENIANELRSQYNVLYRPDPLKTDGLFHPVSIKTRGKDLIVRARKGYYAPRM